VAGGRVKIKAACLESASSFAEAALSFLSSPMGVADLFVMNQMLIKNQDIFTDTIGEVREFPKYTTQIINLANQNAQGTRPRVVGQMSDLIQEFPGRSFEEWKAWYGKRKPRAVEDATDRIWAMISNLKNAINLIDRNFVRDWVLDLVLNKTFTGMRFQLSILKRIATAKNRTYRTSNPEEEAQGIDGYIGDIPVSIKPTTYKIKPGLGETIRASIIFYEKKKDGILIQFE
jgi:hypothetical protein